MVKMCRLATLKVKDCVDNNCHDCGWNEEVDIVEEKVRQVQDYKNRIKELSGDINA